MRNFFLYLFILIGLSCNSSADTKEETTVLEEDALTTTMDEFETFYQKFHTDSIFQKEHILFPLKGLPTNADSAILKSGDFYWQEEDWVTQHLVDPSSGFTPTVLPIDSALIIERIMYKDKQYAMERRFAKMNGEWKLIYYAGVNRIAQ